MGYTDMDDGIYECDGCGKEMSHCMEHDHEDIFCNNECCKFDGIHYTVWMSERLKRDVKENDLS